MYFKIVKITNFIRKYEVGHREGEREAGLSSLSPQSWGEARGHLSLRSTPLQGVRDSVGAEVCKVLRPTGATSRLTASQEPRGCPG